jgi:hypothetical protein
MTGGKLKNCNKKTAIAALKKEKPPIQEGWTHKA